MRTWVYRDSGGASHQETQQQVCGRCFMTNYHTASTVHERHAFSDLLAALFYACIAHKKICGGVHANVCVRVCVHAAIMNVVTLLLVNWRKESDKALKNMAVHNYTPRTHPHEDTFPVALETASLRQTHMQTANGTAGLDGLHHAIDAAEQGVKPGVQQGPGLGVAAITRSASPASVVAAEAAAVALEERTALLQVSS